MKRWIAMAVALVMVLSLCACGEVPEVTTIGGGNLEKPPVTPTSGNQKPTEPKPTQTQPQETEPTQPAVCSHEYVSGACKYCGALKPTEGLVYTLNEDGKSYSLTGVNKSYYDPFTMVIADYYNGLPVTEIGNINWEKASGADELTEVIIPNTVVKIGSGAFEGCDGLVSVEIPDSVTTIGDCAFVSCGLTSIEIPNSVTTIGEEAFGWCDLSKITIGIGLKEIGYNAFYGTSISEVHISSIEAWCAIDFDCGRDNYRGWSNNPLSDGANLYLNGELVTKLVIPEGVTYIGECAFYNCDGLTSISLPDSLVSIGVNAFVGCDNLTYKRYDTAYYLGNSNNPYVYLAKVTGTDISGCNIHKDTKIIADGAFNECRNLTSITLPEGLVSIGDSAFSNCYGLTSIVIPDSVIHMGGSVFSDCSTLASVTLSAGLTEISDHVFYKCGSLKSIIIPNGVTCIRDGAFSDSGLQEIVIPEGVTSIGRYVFSDTPLKSITLPTTLTNIGMEAFADYSWGTKYGPDHVYITSMEAWCGIVFENEKSNPLWDGATLYLNGEAVKEVVIPDGVTSIGNYAFCGSNITSVTIPATVTSIGDKAFASCEKLTSITFAGTMEQWYEVVLGENWKKDVPVKQIICSDGTANL